MCVFYKNAYIYSAFSVKYVTTVYILNNLFKYLNYINQHNP